MMSPTHPALKAAWDKFMSQTEAARVMMEETPRYQTDPEHRAQAYSSLCEALAMAYNFALAPRMDNPLAHTHSWYHPSYYSLGGTSPDFANVCFFLDGRKTYRLSGRFGDLALLLFQGYSHLLGHPDSKMLGNFDLSEYQLGPDRSFEVIISADKHEGNWIPMDAASDYNFFFVRRISRDWYGDMGKLDIQMLDAPEPLQDLDEQAMARRISTAGDFLTFLVKMWNVGIYNLYLGQNDGVKNAVKVTPGEQISKDFIGSPSTIYYWGVYEIAEDQALILECDVPDAGYWSVQIFDVWCRPYDYINRQTDVNMTRAVIDADGKYRAVIALKDPGLANWLDPMGRKEGTIVGRAYHARAKPTTARSKLVPVGDLRAHLPPDTRWVSPAERTEQLAYRKRGWLTMYGER